MNAYKLNAAYGDFVKFDDYDLFLTLNTECEPSRPQLSKLLKKFFYRAECSAFGMTDGGIYRRELYKHKDKFHINRIVAIEGNPKRTHAHCLVRSIDGYNVEEMKLLLAEAYRETIGAKRIKPFLFQAEPIRDLASSCNYITKETAKHNRCLDDVIDLDSSFISKHSYKQ
jgi:hypothetical protein